jgi:hypothetical protein
MKRIMLIALVVLITQAKAQVQMENKDGVAQFQRVIEVEGKNASELYKIASDWVKTTYKNPDKVVTATTENELIKGSGVAPIKLGGGLAAVYDDYRYIFQIDVKDAKVRYTLSNMVLVKGGYHIESYVYKKDGTERTSGQATSVKSETTAYANALITSLEAALKGTAKKDDW